MIFSFQQNARPGSGPATPGKVPFRCKKHTPPPRGRQQGAGGRGGWVAGGWWLGGWVAGWLVAGGWWLLAGWLGKGKVIGFDYYVMS